MSFISMNQSVWTCPCFPSHQVVANESLWFFFSTPRCGNVFVFLSYKYVCVWWEISLLPLIPHLSSFIFTPSTHTHTHRWSRPVEDLPSKKAAGVSAQMFLSAKGAASLEHQRGEIVTHSREKYLSQWDEPIASDSSLENVTPRNEEVAKEKENRIADILFMTINLWHQEIKGINPSPQNSLTVASHSMWGILVCTPKNSEFRLRNWL